MTPMQKREHQHRLCPKRQERQGPHLGLYCAQHGVWLRWISQKDRINDPMGLYLVNTTKENT